MDRHNPKMFLSKGKTGTINVTETENRAKWGEPQRLMPADTKPSTIGVLGANHQREPGEGVFRRTGGAGWVSNPIGRTT